MGVANLSNNPWFWDAAGGAMERTRLAAGGLADAGSGCSRPCRRRGRARLRFFRTASSFAVYGLPSKTPAVWSARLERICDGIVSRPTAGRRRRMGVGGGGVGGRSQEHARCVSLTRDHETSPEPGSGGGPMDLGSRVRRASARAAQGVGGRAAPIA